jgi:ADP-ribose pyrophosphatase YjhB (NUDIX family)
MNIAKAIAAFDKHVKNPSEGLSEELFLFVSRVTPMVNVDLLLKNENGSTLLAWRDDQDCGEGWHLPGGIVRFKEKLNTRILEVAKKEIGTKVEFEPNPIATNEIMLKQKTRGHFVSFLYKCHLPNNFTPGNRGLKETDAGYLKWHNSCPDNLLKAHEIYRRYI